MNLFSLEQTFSLDGQIGAIPSHEFSNALDRLSLGYILFEHGYLGPFAWEALTPFEQSIATGFSERRKKSFIASRISLKLLAHKIGCYEHAFCDFSSFSKYLQECAWSVLPPLSNNFQTIIYKYLSSLGLNLIVYN